MAHENTSQSPLKASVVDSCSVLHVNEFNVDPSALASPREVKKIVKKLKNGKAPGFDGVPNILLKQLPRTAVVYVFNSCIELCYIRNTNSSNYRPISLLSSISKVLEKIIL
jgi:hypothetical protein